MMSRCTTAIDNTGGWGPYHPFQTPWPCGVRSWAPRIRVGLLPNLDPSDGSIVRLETNRSVDAEALLQYYLVIGGGHDWPGV